MVLILKEIEGGSAVLGGPDAPEAGSAFRGGRAGLPLDDEGPVEAEHTAGIDRLDEPPSGLLAIGWVGEDDLERSAQLRPVEDLLDPADDDAGLGRNAE